MFPDILLEFCKSTNPDYKKPRAIHYVEDHGSTARALHFLIWYRGTIVGIISGASATYKVRARDKYFGITAANREDKIKHIVSNTVFRIDLHEYGLASRIVAVWREVMVVLYESFYSDRVEGFETFVDPKKAGCGTLYIHDGWKRLSGRTAGSGKVRDRGFNSGHTRKPVSKKLILVRKHVDTRDPDAGSAYDIPFFDADGIDADAMLSTAWLHPSWRHKTVRDKWSQKILNARRKTLLGWCFGLDGERVTVVKRPVESPEPALIGELT